MGTLTAVAVRGLRTEGKHLDGQGLALVIDRAGRRYWQYRYQRAGRERVMSFGSADDVTLAAARKLHAEARALLLAGKDPLEERDRAKLDLTRRFAEVAEAYITAHEPRWRGPHSARQWRANLRDHVYPAIGKMPVAEIDVHHVLRVLKPIWGKKQVTASRVRSRIEMVLDYATALGWRTGANPAVWRGGLRSLLPAEADLHTVTHFAALNWCDMPALLVELGACDSMPARTLTFLIYTAARTAEARGAVWSEIDLDRALWTIPPARMKSGREQRIPLSQPAMDILRAQAAIRAGDLVFPGVIDGRPLSDTTLRKQLRRLGHGEITVHGFRSSFRDWCADTGKSESLAEAALAHSPGSKVVQAYRRTDLLEARRGLMQSWADHLTGSIVVPLRQAS